MKLKNNSDAAPVAVVLRKSDSTLRWLILVLNCIVMVGVYYTFDFPAAMKTQMNDFLGKPDDFETLYSLLYTIPAIPNIVLPFFGGYFVDTLGAPKCMIVFISLIATGHTIFAFGLSIKSWPVMFVGRAIFGMGETSNSVANSTILSDWFGGKELALAFGLNLSISRLSSVVNNILSPLLAQGTGGIVFSCWCGVALLGCAVGAAILIFPVDKRVQHIIHCSTQHHSMVSSATHVERDSAGKDVNTKEGASTLNPMPLEDRTRSASAEGIAPGLLAHNSPLDDEVCSGEEHIRFSKALEFPLSYRLLTIICLLIYGVISPFNNIASSLLLERSYFVVPTAECSLTIPNECQSSANGPNGFCPTSNSQKSYQPPLPINITYNSQYYSAITAADVDCADSYWRDGCANDFCTELDSSILEANTIMSIPYFMAAVLLPFLGGVVDRYGLRALVLLLVPVGLLIVHSLMGYTDIDPVGLLVGQGLGYTCMAATLWPSFSLIVDKRYTGLAFGIAFSMQNLGLSVIPFIIALIYSNSGDHYIPNVEVFFVSLSACCIIFSLWLNYDDWHNGNVLNSPTKAQQMGSSGSTSAVYEPILSSNGDDLAAADVALLCGEELPHTTRADSLSARLRLEETDAVSISHVKVV